MTTNKKETGKFVSFCSRGLAVLALCGSMLTTVAQDFTTKQAAPKSRVFNLKGATADRLKQADKAAKKAVKAPATLAKHKGRRVFVPWRFVSSQMPTWSLAAAATVETTNANGIITSPAEGVRRVYTRSGMSYRNGNGIETVEQSGAVHIVECTDGTVYVHNILSGFPSGAWVKGTRQGNTITIPSKQPIYFNGNTTFSIRWGVNDEIGFSNYDNYNGGNFTFTVDDAAGTLTLENSSEQMFMGLFWDDDDAFAYQGDYETVWTYESDFQPLPVVTITPPEGLETEKWFAKGHYKSGASDTFKPFVGTLSVGFYGQEVYLQGVFDTTFGEWQSYFEDLPSPMKESWMKGTIDGDVVTFSGLQFAGTVDGLTSYTVGTDGADLTDFIMTWDAEQKVLKSQNQLLLNSLLEDIGYSLWLRDLTIQVEDPNKPIDTLPYANGFESEDEWERFRVIDANHDDSSWQLYSEEDNQEASYKYNSDNDADDWLISPVIRLEAGKTYSFAIDARCSSDAYSERVEVALLEQLPSPLMPTFIPTPLQTIIEPTELQTELPLTLANKFVTVSETGYYQFGIHAISDADHASLRVDNLLVGETIMTAPAAVTDLAVTAADESPVATITFTAPTKNIGGGDLTANLTHVDLLRDNVVIKSFEDVAPGTALTYTDDDEELIGTTYTYMVVAYNADGEGDKSATVTVRLNYVFAIPYVADFTLDAVGGQFTQIDANNDGSRWEWDGGTRATYEYSSENQADDYLISPALHMDAGQRYSITVDAGSAGYTERFEILAGHEPTSEGLSVKVLGDCEVTTEDSKVFEAVFTAEETGVYHVAIHAISDADMYELWIHKVSIEFAPELTAPAAPQLAVVPGEKGAKEATITIGVPQTNIGGDALTANLTKVELYRGADLIKEFEDVAPGTQLSYTDTDIEAPGDYSYQAIPYNADGIGQKSEKVTAYVGFDVPDIVQNVQAVAQGDKVLLTWDKVSETGRNGGYVNPDDVEYIIYACFPNSTYSNGEVASVRDATSCELDFPTNEGEQGYQGWYVAAHNEAGESYVDDASLATVVTGAPYELPLVEGFAGGATHYYWDSNSYPLMFSQSSDDDGVAMALTAQEPGDIYLTSGKLNLKEATNPTLLFDAIGFGVSSVNIIGRTDGGDGVELATETLPSDDYKTVKVSLNSLKDGSFAQVGLTATITNPTVVDWFGDIEEEGDALVVDNIRIVDLVEHNLTAELSAPATVQAGKTATIKATVTNWGEQAAKDFTVVITAGDEELLLETVADELAPFAKLDFDAELATTIFDEAGDRAIRLQVDYAADLKPTDNSVETTIAVVDSDVPAPTNLMAKSVADGVELNWTAPDNEPVDYTEAFDNTEAFPTFGIGGITATQHEGSMADWTLYDGNGSDVYSWGSEGIDYENRYQPSAWMAFDIAKAGFTNETGHSGAQVMLSMCPVPGEEGTATATDHWLISPELPGTEQLISFYLRAITNQYGSESFEVLASKTDSKPESFELVESFVTDEESWNEFTALLPEGTKYFAIRHTSTDVFGVMLDDVTFNYAGKMSHYNVYCQGQLIASVEDGTTTYTVAADELPEGECIFAVTAVYANGQESKPATINVTTDIRQLMTDGQPVDVYTIDGKQLRSQVTTLDGLKGIYVVNGRTVVIK